MPVMKRFSRGRQEMRSGAQPPVQPKPKVQMHREKFFTGRDPFTGQSQYSYMDVPVEAPKQTARPLDDRRTVSKAGVPSTPSQLKQAREKVKTTHARWSTLAGQNPLGGTGDPRIRNAKAEWDAAKKQLEKLEGPKKTSQPKRKKPTEPPGGWWNA